MRENKVPNSSSLDEILNHLLLKNRRITWLELLISHKLNPLKYPINDLEEAALVSIVHLLEQELLALKVSTQENLFNAKSQMKMKTLVKKYHDTYTHLLKETARYKYSLENSKNQCLQIFTTLESFFKEMINWIEIRYAKSICSKKQLASDKILTQTKNEINQVINQLKLLAASNPVIQTPVQIITEAFKKIFQDKDAVTYGDIEYKRRLAKHIINTKAIEILEGCYNTIDILLINQNFNTKRFIEYLTTKIQFQVSTLKSTNEKITRIESLYKTFRQLCKSRKLAYDKNVEPVKSALSRWFKEELKYLQTSFDTSSTSTSPTLTPRKTATKILCNLSIDQLALILRAADDERIITARSLTDVFKNVSPYLSTPKKETISSDSMRSKSYNSEPRDKIVAIETLKQIMLKIKEY